MAKYFDEYDKQILNLWTIQLGGLTGKRKFELLKSARRTHSTSSISVKVGGVLLWQQVLEQFLKEIIQISVSYIKAEIWPTKINMKVEYDKKTFGLIINDYENFSLDYKDKQKIVGKLKLINKNRNEIVHKIFEVDDMQDLEIFFEENFKTYEDLLPLLLDHYIEICHYLEDLKDRVDWQGMLQDLRKR